MEGNKYFSRRSKSYSDSFVKLPVSHTDNTPFYCINVSIFKTSEILKFLLWHLGILSEKTFHLYMSIKILMLIDYYKLIKNFYAQLITLPMYLLLLTVEKEFRKEIFPSINKALTY